MMCWFVGTRRDETMPQRLTSPHGTVAGGLSHAASNGGIHRSRLSLGPGAAPIHPYGILSSPLLWPHPAALQVKDTAEFQALLEITGSSPKELFEDRVEALQSNFERLRDDVKGCTMHCACAWIPM